MRNRRARSGNAAHSTFVLLALLLTGYSTIALADKPVHAEAKSWIDGTNLPKTIRNFASSVPLGPDELPFPLDNTVSPWDIPFLMGGDHGMWVYANEIGRTRTWAYTGASPSPQSGSALVQWDGHFRRDDSSNPTFTINPSSVYVFAQTAGSGIVLSRTGDLKEWPSAKMSIQVWVCRGADLKGCTLAFSHLSEVEGIVGEAESPLQVTENSTFAIPGSGISTNGESSQFGKEEREYVTICVPVSVLTNEVQCSVHETALRFNFPTMTGELPLADFGIRDGDAYSVGYELHVEVIENSSEQYAEALLGDPLDVDAGGITLNTTHTPIASNAHYCSVAPDPNRYPNHGDGTVTDTRTGLMWQRCPLGHTLDENATPDQLADDLCVPGTAVEYDWQGALQNAGSDRHAGFGDWRVPSVKELDSLVETSCYAPTVDTQAFPDTPPMSFWSSTPATESAQSWQVSFADGDVRPTARDQVGLVRLVRSSGTSPLAPTPGLIAGRSEVVEGNSGTTELDFPVILTRRANSDVTVDYQTEAADATEGIDYLATSGTLTIPAGNLSGTIAVTVNGDTTGENSERLRLLLSNPSAGTYLATASSLGTIVDDEPRISAIAAVPEQVEGDGGTRDFEFVVRLDTPAVGTVSVDYSTADGGAVAGDDYVANSGTATFGPGEETASIFVGVNGDTAHENDEEFELTLSNALGGVLSGAPMAIATISDDDGPGSYQALNDSGVTTCTNLSTPLLGCPQAGFPLQDGEVGRDISDNDPNDGLQGFSFTKLDMDGVPLTNQAATYPYVNTPPNSSQELWDCVRDEVTGLTWEIQTDVVDDFRHYDWSYSWYNSTGVNDGGNAGVANGGVCADAVSCDTEKYVAAVNAMNLCGFNDWRLPGEDELFTLAVTAAPSAGAVRGLDGGYFPHNYSTDGRGDRGFAYWSATPSSADPELARTLSFQWPYPQQTLSWKSSAARMQLVRGGL